MESIDTAVPANQNINYYELIRGWAKDRNIIGEGGSTPIDQFIKGLTEAGEFWNHIAKGNPDSLAGLKDDIGDILVCLTNAFGVLDINIEEHINLPDPILNSGYWEHYDRIGMKRTSLGILHALSGIASLLEEHADLSDDIEYDDYSVDAVELGELFSDILYTLTAIARKQGWTIQDCLEQSWNDIKDRKGVMRDGVFVKESDITQDLIDEALSDIKTSPQVAEYLKSVVIKQA